MPEHESTRMLVMIGNLPYSMTEWEWLTTQLRLKALERSAAKFVTRYTFADQQNEPLSKHFPEALIHCFFWCDTTERLLNEKASRRKHLEFYPGWVESEERAIGEIAAHCPYLSKELDLGKHVVYTILHSYGMGSSAVCDFYSGAVHWRMALDSIPE